MLCERNSARHFIYSGNLAFGHSVPVYSSPLSQQSARSEVFANVACLKGHVEPDRSRSVTKHLVIWDLAVRKSGTMVKKKAGASKQRLKAERRAKVGSTHGSNMIQVVPHPLKI